ncbi:MAG: ATP-binding protein, partial [Gemmatimonadota bacterium]
RALVEREFEHWTTTLAGLTQLPGLREAVAVGDVDEVRRRLRILVEANPRVDRGFVTDTTGLLWSDFPSAPESLGRRFSDRDWYRGVRGEPGPYVSQVYRRNAEPRLLLVAVAATVLDPESEDVAGFLVIQVRLDGLTDLLRRVEVGDEGTVLLMDHTGAIVAHPSLDLQSRIYREYAGVPSALVPVENGAIRGEYVDPFDGETMLVSALPIQVGGHRWTVMSQQPMNVAFAPTRALATRMGAAGGLLALLMAGVLWGLGREDRRRRTAEDALAVLNRDLERRVEERTTELRQKEEELHQAQKMEAVGQLAGGVAHDFNNLLTVILANTRFLLDELPAGSSRREDLEQIHEAGSRAEDLTRQLLAFSRKQVLQPTVLDVNEAVERMRGMLERTLGEDVELEWRLSSGLHPVKFDPGKIEQVILNLAVNARDAMPRGGKLTIATANVDLDEDYVEDHPEARTGPHVVLSVTDTGTGMDPATRKRIFEPFFTTKERGTGTGLGLSTVHGIVRQGGGNIWVYSEPGLGTTFKVYLPRTEEVPRPAAEEGDWSGEAGSGTVLVVEDDDAVRAVAVRILEGAGYEVIEASDGEAARAVLRDSGAEVRLLVTDVILPDTVGPELAAELTMGRPGLEILYMSGYTDDALVRNDVLDEETAYIEKPFRPRDLLKKVWEILAREG